MEKTTCANCGKEFLVHLYRLQRKTSLCCSNSCAARQRFVIKDFPYTSVTQEKFAEIGHTYRTTLKTIAQISNEFKIHRSTLYYWVKKHKWAKFPRPVALRTQYRRVASEKIGRPLITNEHVHHIDGNPKNNHPDNLHVLSGSRAHAAAHRSLGICGYHFVKNGEIVFNPKTGFYELAKT